MDEEAITIPCPQCGLNTIGLVPIVDNNMFADLKSCRPCKRDFKANGKFTREKVKRDLSGANKYADELTMAARKKNAKNIVRTSKPEVRRIR